MTLVHYSKKQDATSHPIKKRKREADKVCFQYMCKELDSSVVIFKQGFTDEDLQELHALSDASREETKSKLGEYVTGQVNFKSTDSPKELHKRVCRAAVQYYLAEDKMQQPNLRLLCRHILLKYAGTPPVIDYIADLLM